MLRLHCTQKVRRQFDIPHRAKDAAEPGPSDAALGDWYVTLVTIDRRKTLIFMNGRTLLSFLLYGVKKRPGLDLAELFVRGAVQLLELEGFTAEEIRRALGAGSELRYACANDRQALGNLSDLQRLYKARILDQGGFSASDIGSLVRMMNRVPQRNLGWSDSITRAREAIAAR